ncbi:MAG TPA: winged helix-turn-helix domain-containing protein [Candidatus Paceibacterota bacterium]|nr:winged helix-turn-helix domain-containing protein [Candidatus Paceibacterota bacterium]
MEPLSKIFGSPARLKALRLFLFNQNLSLTLGEIAARTKLSPASVRRELSDLVAAGLLRKKGARTSARYQVNPRFEHLAALDAFIRETTSVRPQDILAALRRTGTLQLVVLSGLFVGILEPKVDLLIVGDHLDERILVTTIHSLEAELGREIRYAFFATADFKYRRGVYDRLLRDIFDYPHRVLIDKVGL